MNNHSLKMDCLTYLKLVVNIISFLFKHFFKPFYYIYGHIYSRTYPPNKKNPGQPRRRFENSIQVVPSYYTPYH